MTLNYHLFFQKFFQHLVIIKNNIYLCKTTSIGQCHGVNKCYPLYITFLAVFPRTEDSSNLWCKIKHYFT